MILKLVVKKKNSEQSKILLNYIEEVLKDLNNVGIKIFIIGATRKDAKNLKKRDIKFIPALIIGDGGRKIYKKTPILNEISKVYKSLKDAKHSIDNPYKASQFDTSGDVVNDYLISESKIIAEEEDDADILEAERKKRLKEYNDMREQSKMTKLASLNQPIIQQYRNNVDTNTDKNLQLPEANNQGELDLSSFKQNANDQDDIMMASFLENHS